MKSAMLFALVMGLGLGSHEAEEAATELKQALGQTLKAVVAEKGPAGAIEFCSLQAIPMTAQVSERLGVALTRVTDRPRNPDNLASADEIKLLQRIRHDIKEGQMKAIYQVGEVFYSPLRVQEVCLNCHGSELTPELQSSLTERYPADQAKGYSLGELRGAIKIAPATAAQE